jgi:hypothetical protein
MKSRTGRNDLLTNTYIDQPIPKSRFENVRLFRNLKTGKRFLAVKEPNGDVIYAELGENNKPINAGNRYPKD